MSLFASECETQRHATDSSPDSGLLQTDHHLLRVKNGFLRLFQLLEIILWWFSLLVIACFVGQFRRINTIKNTMIEEKYYDDI